MWNVNIKHFFTFCLFKQRSVNKAKTVVKIHGLGGQKISEYDQEIPQSNNADQPMAP